MLKVAHPNIVRIVDVYKQSKKFVSTVYEYVDPGEGAFTLVPTGDENEALNAFLQLALAFKELH